MNKKFLVVNETPYTIKYTINTLCDMKGAGIDVMKLEDAELDFVAIRALFFFGLQKQHKAEVKTQEDAGELMSDYLENGGTFEELTNIITGALTRSLGLKDVAEGKQQVKLTQIQTLRTILIIYTKFGWER